MVFLIIITETIIKIPFSFNSYYRGAMGIMLVYDITNDKSFDNIKNWIRNIEEHASADVEKMILGNKCDMNDKRQVKFFNNFNNLKTFGLQFVHTRSPKIAENNSPSSTALNSWKPAPRLQ